MGISLTAPIREVNLECRLTKKKSMGALPEYCVGTNPEMEMRQSEMIRYLNESRKRKEIAIDYNFFNQHSISEENWESELARRHYFVRNQKGVGIRTDIY